MKFELLASVRSACSVLFFRIGVVISVCSEHYAKLQELEESAKSAGRGKWNKSSNPQEHIRANANLDEPRKFYEANRNKAVKGQCELCPYDFGSSGLLFAAVAVVEFVRDACTVRAIFLPDFISATVIMTGIRVRGCTTEF